jgi:hypothetical protein
MKNGASLAVLPRGPPAGARPGSSRPPGPGCSLWPNRTPTTGRTSFRPVRKQEDGQKAASITEVKPETESLELRNL